MRQLGTSQRLILAVGIPVLAAIVWHTIVGPKLLALPDGYHFRADLISRDNFYDPAEGQFRGSSRTIGSLTYDVYEAARDEYAIHGKFIVRHSNLGVVVSISRSYAVDPVSFAFVTSTTSPQREGYFFSPRLNIFGKDYTYWHINYDAPARMTYVGTEEKGGLRTYRYRASYEGQLLDQTESLGHLEGVGERLGILVEPQLDVWVEPITGYLIDYEENATAYFYELSSGERLSPWNQFSNTLSEDSVSHQAMSARSERARMLLVGAVAPLLLILGSIPATLFALRSTRRSESLGARGRHTFAAFSILVALLAIVTLSVWLLAQSRIEREARGRFVETTDRAATAIQGKMDLYTAIIYGLRGFLESAPGVTQEQWDHYIAALRVDALYRGVTSVSYIERVPRSEVPAFRHAITPFVEKSVYYPTKFNAYFGPDKAPPLGIDISSERIRWEALKSSAERRTPVATPVVTGLVNPVKILSIYNPVFKSSETPGHSHDELQGFASVGFRTDSLMETIVHDLSISPHVQVRVYDAEMDAPDRGESLIYEWSDAESGSSVSLTRSVEILLGGRVWTLEFSADEDFASEGTPSSAPDRLLIAGGIVDVLIVLVVASFAVSRSRAYELADKMTLDVRQSHERLAYAKARDDAMLNSLGEGVFSVDKAANITYINAYARDLLRLTDAAIGRPFYDVVALVDAYGTSVPEDQRPLNKAMLTGVRVSTTVADGFSTVLSDGRAIPITVHSAPIVQDGCVVGGVAVFRDATREYAMDKTKSEFVAIAAHQLRTPLATIRWYLDLMYRQADSSIGGKMLTYYEAIRDANSRMVNLVGDLLAATRADSNAHLKVEPVDLAELVGNVVQMEKEASRSMCVGIKIIHVGRDFVVRSDKRSISMALQNVLSNAIKYSKSGSSVTISLERHMDDGTVLVRVTDQGIGIPDAAKAGIFTKMFRADNAKSHDAGGSGLGLYIARTLLERIGGDISFVSDGNGTTFIISVPANRA